MLTRMGIPHGWYQAGSAEGRRLLEEAGQDGSRLPVVLFHSGQVFVDPSDAELAEALGVRDQPGAGSYDLVIVGAGPAGLAAAVYAASEGLRHRWCVEPEVAGGQAGTSHDPQLPGLPARDRAAATWPTGRWSRPGCSGPTSCWPSGPPGCAPTAPGAWSTSRTGARSRPRRSWSPPACRGGGWACPSWRRSSGPGCFYGAAGAEARAMEGEDVFVVGAGNSAGQAALHLAQYAASVTVLVRGPDLAAEHVRLPGPGARAGRRTSAVRLRTEVGRRAGRPPAGGPGPAATGTPGRSTRCRRRPCS